jgi:hypothetical protein
LLAELNEYACSQPGERQGGLFSLLGEGGILDVRAKSRCVRSKIMTPKMLLKSQYSIFLVP